MGVQAAKELADVVPVVLVEGLPESQAQLRVALSPVSNQRRQAFVRPIPADPIQSIDARGGTDA